MQFQEARLLQLAQAVARRDVGVATLDELMREFGCSAGQWYVLVNEVWAYLREEASPTESMVWLKAYVATRMDTQISLRATTIARTTAITASRRSS